MYYLKRKLLGKKIIVNAVAEVNIYDFSPWDLPDKSSLKSGDLEWYFFCPKSKKYLTGARANRATEKGYWKATGKDRKVEYNGRTVANIKTLVFHLGHASIGERTNWVMHEYNMNDKKLADQGIIQDMYALCKIFEKEGAGPKNGAQYGAPFKEEEWDDEVASSSLTGPGPVVGPDGPTNKLDDKQKGKASVSLTEPCSSTVTENVTHGDNPFNDDVMFLEDIEAVMGGPISNNKIEGVNEDDIFDDLANLVNLDELNNGDELKDDVAKYTQEMFMGVDDLDADLGGFYVD